MLPGLNLPHWKILHQHKSKPAPISRFFLFFPYSDQFVVLFLIIFSFRSRKHFIPTLFSDHGRCRRRNAEQMLVVPEVLFSIKCELWSVFMDQEAPGPQRGPSRPGRGHVIAAFTIIPDDIELASAHTRLESTLPRHSPFPRPAVTGSTRRTVNSFPPLFLSDVRGREMASSLRHQFSFGPVFLATCFKCGCGRRLICLRHKPNINLGQKRAWADRLPLLNHQIQFFFKTDFSA